MSGPEPPAPGWWARWTQRRQEAALQLDAARHPAPSGLWEQLRRRHSRLADLALRSPAWAARHEVLTAAWLARVQVRGLNGSRPDELAAWTAAALCVRPVLALGLEALGPIKALALSADSFTSDLETWEGPVVRAGRDERSGEYQPLGVLVLSVRDLRSSARGEGYDVAVHEVAHVLDAGNGDLDGCPALPRGLSPVEWRTAFEAAWNDQRRRGRRAPIDPYAGTDPAEYFAVACEEFFDRPARLRRHLPEVYALLSQFFKLDLTGAEAGPILDL